VAFCHSAVFVFVLSWLHISRGGGDRYAGLVRKLPLGIAGHGPANTSFRTSLAECYAFCIMPGRGYGVKSGEKLFHAGGSIAYKRKSVKGKYWGDRRNGG
jgi:hypothetical protein